MPTCGWSRNQNLGVNKTKIRIRTTATSYCQVPRSYDQKNVLERICFMPAISVRGNAIDDHTITHMHDAVEMGDRFGIVSDHHDSLPQVLVKLAQHLQHDFGIFGIEIAGGLVGEQDFRLVDDSAGNRHSLLLAARKLGGLVVQAPLQAQHFGNHVEAVGIEAIAMDELRDGDVALGGQSGQQIETLENEANFMPPQLGTRRVTELRQIVAVDEDMPAGGLRQSAYHVKKRRFSTARRTHNRNGFSRQNFEVDAAKRRHFDLTSPVELPQTFGF